MYNQSSIYHNTLILNLFDSPFGYIIMIFMKPPPLNIKVFSHPMQGLYRVGYTYKMSISISKVGHILNVSHETIT